MSIDKLGAEFSASALLLALEISSAPFAVPPELLTDHLLVEAVALSAVARHPLVAELLKRFRASHHSEPPEPARRGPDPVEMAAVRKGIVDVLKALGAEPGDVVVIDTAGVVP
jgi:hypothetical protein